MNRGLDRLSDALRRYGPAGLVSRAAVRGTQLVFLREAHIWYTLDLRGERPKRALPDGFRLHTATPADTPAVAELPNQAREAILRERVAGPVDIYVVSEGDTPAFACSVFRERTPVATARGGWLELPRETVCIEDSGTSSEFRGRGLAPGAWAAIADDLEGRGFETMITKVAVDNEPSRRAVTKAGFREGTEMRTRRTGPRTRYAFTPLGAPGAEFVSKSLSR